MLQADYINLLFLQLLSQLIDCTGHVKIQIEPARGIVDDLRVAAVVAEMEVGGDSMITQQETQIRRIKVNQFYYDYKPKSALSNFIVPPVPWLQLKGKWLEKAGFSINAPVKVTVSQGCLILTTKLKQ